MKPKIVKESVVPVSSANSGGHRNIVEWEAYVFDNVVKFSVAWFAGRGNKGRQDHGTDFAAAVAQCMTNDRAVIYACDKNGRAVCLDRKDWPALLTKWQAKKVQKNAE